MDSKRLELTPEQLRWRYDPDRLDFSTTREVDSGQAAMGQPDAIEALEFGLRCDAPGQNIYVRGVRSTGRLTMIQRLLKRLDLTTDGKRDRCYVHNFSRPDRPRLIEFPPGDGPVFARAMKELANFIGNNLRKAFENEPILSLRRNLEKKIQESARQITRPLEEELAENDMAMVQIQQGPVTQTAIVPTVNGKPVPPEQLEELIQKEEVPEEVLKSYEAKLPGFREKLQETTREVSEVYLAGRKQLQDLIESEGRKLLETTAGTIRRRFGRTDDSSQEEATRGNAVHSFLEEVIQDAIDIVLTAGDDEAEVDFDERYGVNVVLTHDEKRKRPVVEEIAPTFLNLMGTVEPTFNVEGRPESDYRGIRGGALLRADQGYLILNVNDLVAEPGAWRALMRTLRTGQLEMVPPEAGFMRPYMVVQPEPIKIRVRVILIGESRMFYELDYIDSDFRELFKVLVDIDDELARDDAGVMQYAYVISRLASEYNLPPFDSSSIARLAEHGARIVARDNRLSARFGRIEDIAREAAFLAITESGQDSQKPCHRTDPKSPAASAAAEAGVVVTADHVTRAIARTKKRAGLPSRRFQQMVERRTIIVQTSGVEIGQINGLAVMQSGQLTYGFPARITATIGPGRAGIINIEGQAQMSGAIHTKGFHILGGLLRHLLHTSHPLAFSASLAFEQSYGGIDGDSASGAEVVCLLSALTEIPVKQSMAMTGAIDQKGNLEAIGGVNEKIEGFFDACQYFGLTGEQGVVVPASNAGDLMLREDIVEACRQGQFHVYAVNTIFEAMELMTGVDSGCDPNQPVLGQTYPPESILGKAVAAAQHYWQRTLAAPDGLTTVETLIENPVEPPRQVRKPD